MNLDMTISAIGILRIQVMLRAGRLLRPHPVSSAMTCQAELGHATGNKHPWVSRPMRRMARGTTVRLDGRMLINKRALLVRMTLNTSRIRASG